MNRVMNALRGDWGWAGVDFAEIIAVSRMGHLLLSDTSGTIHYLDPETRELICLGGEEQARQYLADPEVSLVWQAEKLVQAAQERLGPPEAEEVYTLTPDALLAGDYDVENLTVMPLAELISFAGQVAWQTRNMADNTPIKLKSND